MIIHGAKSGFTTYILALEETTVEKLVEALDQIPATHVFDGWMPGRSNTLVFQDPRYIEWRTKDLEISPLERTTMTCVFPKVVKIEI